MDEATAMLHSMMPLCETLDMRGVESSADRVVIEMDWAEDRTTTAGLLHGGAVMALADSAGAVCAFLNLPDGVQGTATIESKSNFLGAVTDGTAVAAATPLHVGGTTIVVETEVRRSGDDKLVAKITQTQAVLR